MNLLVRTKVQEFQEQVDNILELLGYPDALVSDESEVGDFLSDDEIESVDQLCALNDCIGVKAGRKTKLWELGRSMEAYE